MTNIDNELKAQFSIEAAQAKNASEILEIAKNIFGNLENHADYIITFAEQKEIPINEELQKLLEQTTKAKEEAEKRKQQDDAKATVENNKQTLEEYLKNLSDGHSPDEPEMMKAAAKIAKEITKLTTPQEQSHIATFDGYLQECLTYDPSKDFSPHLFGNIPFPNGTVSYIGARTSRGKTASMINLARETLMHADNPRKVIFITLEMSPKELITRLVLSISYARATENSEQDILRKIGDDVDKKLLNNYYYNYILKARESSNEGFKTFQSYTNKTIESVRRFMAEKQLIIYDARTHDFETITSTIKSLANTGDIVLLDYIQRMPSTNKPAEGFMRVKLISEGICQAAASTDAVIIAGAQFNRESNADETKDDGLSEKNFRESGDLEQDAHNAIGIGWTSDKSTRFYRILKTRSSDYVGDSFEFIWNGAYCYMAKSIFEYEAQDGKAYGSKTTKGKTNKTNAFPSAIGSIKRKLEAEES